MLRPKRKLTKRDIKHDPLLEAFYSAQKFYERNRNRLALFLGVILVSAAIIFVAVTRNISTQRTSGDLLAKGLVSYYAGDYSQAVDELDLLVADYPNSRPAREALFYMGKAHFYMDEYPEAERLLEEYRERAKNDLLRVASIQILAAIAESEGRYVDAAGLFQLVSTMAEYPFTDHQNRVNAAANWIEAGELDKAFEILEGLKNLDGPHRLIEDQVKELSARLSVASVGTG